MMLISVFRRRLAKFEPGPRCLGGPLPSSGTIQVNIKNMFIFTCNLCNLLYGLGKGERTEHDPVPTNARANGLQRWPPATTLTRLPPTRHKPDARRTQTGLLRRRADARRTRASATEPWTFAHAANAAPLRPWWIPFTTQTRRVYWANVPWSEARWTASASWI